jgi:molybdopterin/thiamine biosynthesis adenylyltransferase
MMEEKNDVEFEVYSRSALLLGENAAPQLTNKRVALFGVGGVGSYCAEALVRGQILTGSSALRPQRLAWTRLTRCVSAFMRYAPVCALTLSKHSWTRQTRTI